MKVTAIRKKGDWDWEACWILYEKMIYEIAFFMLKRYSRMDFELNELVSEGWTAVMVKAKRYDREYGLKSTWVYNCAYYGMKNYCVNRTRRNFLIPLTSLSAEDSYWDVEERKDTWLQTFMNEIGEEARQLIQTIVDAPEELSEVLSPQAPKESWEAVRTYMVDVMDWKKKRLKRMRKEIRASLP